MSHGEYSRLEVGGHLRLAHDSYLLLLVVAVGAFAAVGTLPHETLGVGAGHLVRGRGRGRGRGRAIFHMSPLGLVQATWLGVGVGVGVRHSST